MTAATDDVMVVTAHLLYHASHSPRGDLDGEVADAWRRVLARISAAGRLAEKWERESGIALGNADALKPASAPTLTKLLKDTLEAESCRVAHGYLQHCAGELRRAMEASS